MEPGYRSLPFPRARNLVVDACRHGWRKHTIHGLFEVDVTAARRRLREREAETGESLSFTGFVVRCVARSIADDPVLHAYRDWRRRLIVFDDVDVDVIVERAVGGTVMGSGHVVRGAHEKSVETITADLRDAQGREVRSADHPLWSAYLYLPGFARNALWRIAGRFPKFVKRAAGTVSVTAVGMFAGGGGWGIALGSHTTTVTVGGIAEKPVAVDGRVEIRELLGLTLSFDHDIVDGAPAARFARRLQERIERADGL